MDKFEWLKNRNEAIGTRTCMSCGEKVPTNLGGFTEFLYRGYGDCPKCQDKYILNRKESID